MGMGVGVGVDVGKPICFRKDIQNFENCLLVRRRLEKED